MPGIPDGILKLTFSGTIASGAEKWAFSIYFNGYTGINDGTAVAYDATTEPTSTTYTNFRAAMLALMLPSDQFTQIDAYYYHGGVAVQHGSVSFVHAGTSGNQPQAAQVAAVLTFRTALSTRSGRGRIYLPAGGQAVDTTRHFVGVTINACVDTFALWMGSIALGNPTHQVVVSQTTGSYNVVTSIDADLVPDTQRRRRNKLVGPRHSHSV